MPTEIERQQFAGKDLLQHRRGHTENADPRGDVEPQHHPQQPELRSAAGNADVHLDRGIIADRFLRLLTRRMPAHGRQAIAKGTGEHKQRINRRQRQNALPYPVAGRPGEVIHQTVCQRRPHQRSPAKTHNRHPGRHSALVRKPAQQRRNR